MTVGVVLPFYAGARPDELRDSLDSILNQDRAPEEAVLAADGPVSEELLQVVEDCRGRSEAARKPTAVRLLQLPENVGGARARTAGISVLDTDYVVGQDAQFMQEHDLDFAGSYVGEFQDDPNGPLSVRRYPTTPEELRRAFRSTIRSRTPRWSFGVPPQSMQALPAPARQ